MIKSATCGCRPYAGPKFCKCPARHHTMRGCIRHEILIDSIACGGGEPAREAEIRSMAAPHRARTAAMFPKCPLQRPLDYRLQKFRKVLCCQRVEYPFPGF